MIPAPRRGSLLILVAGLTALLASLALAFMVRTRTESEAMLGVVRDAQARMMLAAGVSYIQETSRLGWDDPTTSSTHDEAYGWVDVRGGVRDLDVFRSTYGREPTTAESLRFPIGPRTQADFLDEGGNSVVGGDGIYDRAWSEGGGSPVWPAIGGVARADVYAMERPPWSVSIDATPNVIQQDRTQPDFGLPLLRFPDPMPAFGPDMPGADMVARDNVSDRMTSVAQVGPDLVKSTAAKSARFALWRTGDPTPRAESLNKSWFRVLRDGPATFVVTCGSGASHGFRSWAEVTAAGQDAFFGTVDFFRDIRATEVILWYRVEWSPAVIHSGTSNSKPTASYRPDWLRFRGSANQGGTIQYIQRLRHEPAVW